MIYLGSKPKVHVIVILHMGIPPRKKPLMVVIVLLPSPVTLGEN